MTDERQSALVVAEQLRRAVPGGIGTYVRGLLQGVQALGERGPEVTLYASRGPELDERFPRRMSRLPDKVLTRLWALGLVGVPPGFDVVHATSLAMPPTRGAPLSVMVHDLAWRQVPEAYPPHGRRWHEAALHRAIAHASLLVTPSRETAHALVAAGAEASRVEVVEHGCDHLPAPDRAGARARLAAQGVEGDYLLSVSTLEPRKNLPRLVEAYGAARRRLPDPWPLVVVGPAGWGQSLQPGPGVVALGEVTDAELTALMADARCLAYVPLVEGFGLPAVEAMAVGTPVVASPMPSTRGAAREVDPLDVAGLAEALVEAAADDSVRAGLVIAGRARAGRLTWREAARRHSELWQSIAR